MTNQPKPFQNFWEKGNGKELLQNAKTHPPLVDIAKFSHLYHQIDILADQVVEDTYLKLPYYQANELIQKYGKNPIEENENTPLSIKKLFLQMQKIPDWYQEDLANIGARFCMRTGTNALIILRDFSLMGGYDFAYLNKPLVFTGALKKGAVKRLKDTLEFWVMVTRENALKINSEAYQLILRTRLMHSYARLSIKNKTSHWNYEAWGEPINHWDMIATYIGFSMVFMQGLSKLGITISEEEEAGVYHLWKYIGYLLGIPSEYLPENKKEATEIFYSWTTVQQEGDSDSAQLAHALLQENLENTIYPFFFQRKLLLKLHQSMNWFLLDEDICKRLQIPKPKILGFFPKIIIALNQYFQKKYQLSNHSQYMKLVNIGNEQQTKVLKDYIKHTPKDFHY